jgi:hypothetical protein
MLKNFAQVAQIVYASAVPTLSRISRLLFWFWLPLLRRWEIFGQALSFFLLPKRA